MNVWAIMGSGEQTVMDLESRAVSARATKLIFITLSITCEPRHEISYNVVCATNKASDQPAHTRSLIRAFASRLNILRMLSY